MRHLVKLTLLASLATPALAVEVQQRPLTSRQAPAPTVIAPSAPQTAINPAWDIFQQIEGLQNQLARLQGQVEEQQMLIERLQSDLRVRYQDLDQRLEALSTRGVSAAPAPLQATASDSSGEFRNIVDYDATPEQIEAQKAEYLAAYQQFRENGAAAAIKAMQAFLKKHPKSLFSASAHYWLGEFQMALEPANLQAAETNFLKVIRDFDTDPRVPAAYYQLALVAQQRNEASETRRWMSDLVRRFPDSDEARLARSWLEQNPAAAVAP